mmetsp:Transcript_23976/g.71344  ORF Transcript_23976/g.71344 Transcript_23976/m.71344 type:complete len:226 (+) Transcript_23976:313-990(+)
MLRLRPLVLRSGHRHGAGVGAVPEKQLLEDIVVVVVSLVLVLQPQPFEFPVAHAHQGFSRKAARQDVCGQTVAAPLVHLVEVLVSHNLDDEVDLLDALLHGHLELFPSDLLNAFRMPLVDALQVRVVQHQHLHVGYGQDGGLVTQVGVRQDHVLAPHALAMSAGHHQTAPRGNASAQDEERPVMRDLLVGRIDHDHDVLRGEGHELRAQIREERDLRQVLLVHEE